MPAVLSCPECESNNFLTPCPKHVTDIPADAPEWAREIIEGQRIIGETLNNILRKFDEISKEVAPMIATISKHPMLKMLGVGK